MSYGREKDTKRERSGASLLGGGDGDAMADLRLRAGLQRRLILRKAEASAEAPEAEPQTDGESDTDSKEQDGFEVSQPGDAAELEADRVADHVAEGTQEQAPEIGAKLEGVGRKIFLAPDDDELATLGRKYDLNAASATSRQVLENFQMKCKDFIASYRKASINAEFPSEYLELTVQQALDADKSKVRKLLIDGRFAK